MAAELIKDLKKSGLFVECTSYMEEPETGER